MSLQTLQGFLADFGRNQLAISSNINPIVKRLLKLFLNEPSKALQQ